ncbi:DUF4124 domain-containing protein [Derxia lacustris]|uniref:DUF4124 domain-containing protein n=1 Tax=Derxia lacustris TaxID=764842 RepID=UPI000A1746B2|nr:DUF4124 domain-containing protein [Derxia lacustris]
MPDRSFPMFRRHAGLLALGAALLLPVAVQAQWAWKDSNGSTVFSDQPPPSSVPADRILRRPSGAAATTPPATPAGAAPTAAPRSTTAELANEFEKRRKERGEAERKETEAAAQKQQRAEDCQRVSQRRDAVAGGLRMRSLETGAVMGDAEREAEVARLDEQLTSLCQ